MANRVKNDEYDAEINAMALELKKKYQKVSTTTKSAIGPNKADHTQNNNQQQLSEYYDDVESYKGKFCWTPIGKFILPSITRVINGEHVKFIALRVAELQLLYASLKRLNASIFKCALVKSYFITISEAKLLNEINIQHTDCEYGNEIFVAGKDLIVRLEDVIAIHTFAEICYNKLLNKQDHKNEKKCGFFKVGRESALPYCIKNDQMYVPIFLFEGQIENLVQQSIEISGWELAYFKFCGTVLGIKEELLSNDSYLMVNIDIVKNYYPPEIEFKEYWPDYEFYSHLINQNNSSGYTNMPNVWVRAPPQTQSAENCTNISTVPGSVMPHSAPVMMNNYEDNIEQNPSTSRGYIADRNIAAQGYNEVNSYGTEEQKPSTSRGYNADRNVAAQSNNAVNSYGTEEQKPSTSRGYNADRNVAAQSNNAVNSYGTEEQQPSTSRGYNADRNVAAQSNNATTSLSFVRPRPIIGDTLLYIDVITGSPDISIHEPITSRNIISNKCQHFFNHRASSSSEAYRQQNEQHSMPIIIDIIDLTSPPSSPTPQMVQVTSFHPTERCNLTNRVCEEANRLGYKIQKAILEGQTFHCINLNPYIYSDMMITINDLVQLILPSTTVERCVLVLTKHLKITLHIGNFEQITILKEIGCTKSSNPLYTPLAKLQEVVKVLPQLKKYCE